MRKGKFFWMLALMICAAGCADNLTDEPKLPMQEKASHEVTQAEARQSLEKIVFDLKIPSTRGGEPRRVPPITSVYSTGRAAEATRSGEEIEPYFHIFNFGNDEGFAIMSGDDRVEPLLALTFKGEFTPETEIDNPGFEIAYSRMEDYYIQRTRIGPSINPDIPVPPKDSMPQIDLVVRTTIEEGPLISYDMPFGYCPVKWGQRFPYNIYCGLPELGLYAYTGCVATAVAQLMSIYRHPSNYDGYTFDWNLMNQYIYYDEDHVNQHPYMTDSIKFEPIARLMRQLGLPHNLNVSYEVVAPGNGSGADPDNIPRTLRNFGYTNGGTKISYSTSHVANELKAGYPVLIGGRTDEDKGHRWLGHGVMELHRTFNNYNASDELVRSYTLVNTYILCNWGWNGRYDGYFYSGVFDVIDGLIFPDPSDTRSVDEYNYQHEVSAFVNIRK